MGIVIFFTNFTFLPILGLIHGFVDRIEPQNNTSIAIFLLIRIFIGFYIIAFFWIMNYEIIFDIWKILFELII
jgi:hypothetical protein